MTVTFTRTPEMAHQQYEFTPPNEAVVSLATALAASAEKQSSQEELNPYDEFQKLMNTLVGHPDPEMRRGNHQLPGISRETRHNGYHNYSLYCVAAFNAEGEMVVARKDPYTPPDESYAWLVTTHNILTGVTQEQIVQDVVVKPIDGSDVVTLDIMPEDGRGVNKLQFSLSKRDYGWDQQPVTFLSDTSYGRSPSQEVDQTYDLDVGLLATELRRAHKPRCTQIIRPAEQNPHTQRHSRTFCRRVGQTAV